MPGRNLLSYSCLLALSIVLGSCDPMELDTVGETYLDLPSVRYNYNNFTDTTNTLSTLGRVLFYDRQLSINNTISCSSCHKQSAAFADNQRFSRGFEGKLTSRNSMPIQNIDFGGSALFSSLSSFKPMVDPITSNSAPFSGQHLFWDGRETSLQKLVLQPVGNHIEMGIKDADALAEKLSALPYYQSLFTEAFQTSEVTPERISMALTAFTSSIRTGQTRFDAHNISKFSAIDAGTTAHSDLTPLELEGMMLFDQKYKCNSCHQVTSPIGYIFAGTFANIGLDKVYADNGLSDVTGDPADAGKFRIPSLRNVSHTAPYMHDGRFETLEEVIHHYSEGMADHPNLDARLQRNGTAQSMNISEHETQAIIAFLRTLNDESVLTDPKFSNPFKTR
ncbi:MAG TPA: cytochrome c peroxidase [Cyclobacteriaceae bacterium]|nr:cytochrome c peroxidase [Cyclobacteriaceae bacterium]